MYACLILHNMIIRHYRETNPGHVDDELDEDMFGQTHENTRGQFNTGSFPVCGDVECNPSFSSKTHVELVNALVKEMAKSQ